MLKNTCDEYYGMQGKLEKAWLCMMANNIFRAISLSLV